VSLFFQKQIT